MSDQTLWRISWRQIASPEDDRFDVDPRPAIWPPPEGLIAFWRAEAGDGHATIVALVRSSDLTSASCLVLRAWQPGFHSWGYRRPYESRLPPPRDRFPPPRWSVEMGRWPWPENPAPGLPQPTVAIPAAVTIDNAEATGDPVDPPADRFALQTSIRVEKTDRSRPGRPEHRAIAPQGFHFALDPHEILRGTREEAISAASSTPIVRCGPRCACGGDGGEDLP